MQKFFLNFNSPELILYSLVGLVFFSYITVKVYKSILNLSEEEKKLFIIIRVLIWVIFFLLFIEPVFNLNLFKIEKNKLIVLIDNSASMLIRDKNKMSRIEKVKKIITGTTIKDLKDKFKFKIFLFGSSVMPLINSKNIESINGSDYSTDIDTAFYSLLSSGIKNSQIILLSDGNSTTPFDIIKTSKLLGKIKASVYTINLFKNENVKDISIYDVYYPDEIGVNSKFDLKFKISLLNYKTVNTVLSIRVNDKLYRQIKIKLNKNMNKLSVKVALSRKGINKIKVEINGLPDEAIRINNNRTFFIRAIKNKFDVLLVYGKPCWECKFLKYNFDTDANIRLTSFVKLKKDSLLKLSRENLKDYDLFIIGNIKYRDLPIEFVNKLIDNINRRRIGVIFTGGENSFKNGDYHISKFKNIIPINWKQAGEIFESSSTMNPTPAGLISSVFKMNDFVESGLPPFDKINIVKGVKPGTQILAVSSVRKDFIILAIGKYRRSKIAIFTAYPTWQWGFLNIGNKDMSDYFSFWRQFTQEMISDNFLRFQLYTDKLIYRKNENIKINLIAYKNNYTPLSVRKVTAKLYIKKKNFYKFVKDIELNRNNISAGLYESQMDLNNYGDYKISADVRELKKTANTYFIIKKPFKELYNLSANINGLKRLSTITGGKYIDLNEIGELKNYLHFKPIKKHVKIKLLLWDNWIILLLLIGLLSFEWWLRKKKGLL